MPRVVLVHGIGQQNSTAAEQVSHWLPSLVKGVLRSGHPSAGAVGAQLSANASSATDLAMAFYGDLYLTPGEMGDSTVINSTTAAASEALATALLQVAVARGDGKLATEAAVTLAQADQSQEVIQGGGAVARGVMGRLDGNKWLSARIFGLAQRAKTDLDQVALYVTEDALRAKIKARVSELIDESTTLVVAHSLGSVIAWEACHGLEHSLPMLLTIGSPLGLDTIIYPRLRPTPPTFPPAVYRWVNIAHPDDIIAAEPRLQKLFPSNDNRKVEDSNPKSSRQHHAAETYLEQPEAGAAIADALSSARTTF
jgi:hypothetical protein